MTDENPITAVPAEPLGGHIRVLTTDASGEAEWARRRDGRWCALGHAGSGYSWPALVHLFPQAVVIGRLQPVSRDRGRPATHSTGPDTETATADLMRPRAGTLREKALQAIAAAEPHGLTDAELAEKTGTYLYSIAPRRGELLVDGWVMDSGQRRYGPRNRPQVVWVLTGPAIDELLTSKSG